MLGSLGCRFQNLGLKVEYIQLRAQGLGPQRLEAESSGFTYTLDPYPI